MPLSQPVRKNSHILWTISLIQDISPDAQTKAEFSEMVGDVLAVDTIEKTTLCLADNLQRFRFMIQDGLTEEEAITKCQEMAKTWHVDNADSLAKLKETKNLSILTWDEFLHWSDYEKTVKEVENLYREDRRLRHDIDARLREELKKIKSDVGITDPVKQADLLKKYLFEECAFQKFAASNRFKYELYKKPFPPAARRIKTNTNFVPPGFMTELYFTQFSTDPKNKPIAQNSNIQTGLIPYENIPIGLDFPPMWSNTTSYHYPAESNKASFVPVFSTPKKPNISTRESTNFAAIQRVVTFIEHSLHLLPEKDKEKAIESLIKFTNQEIIPLCYTNSSNELKT